MSRAVKVLRSPHSLVNQLGILNYRRLRFPRRCGRFGLGHIVRRELGREKIALPGRLLVVLLGGQSQPEAAAAPAFTHDRYVPLDLFRRSYPVGATFKREAKPSEPEQAFEIVGLVGDTKYRSLREDFQPIAFLSINQDGEPDSSAQIVTRSSLPLQQTTAAIRGVLMRINPIITANFHSYATTVEEGLLRERLMATLSGFFGVLGALISAVGLYGVMSYLVARRSSEIGVRIALGATSSSIVALILRQAALLLVFGVAAGTVLTFALAGAAKSLIFGLKPFDLPTLALATTLLAAVAALASYLPARRASHIEPLRAIRQE